MAESCTGPAEASRGLALVHVGMGSRLHADSLENKSANPKSSSIVSKLSFKPSDTYVLS